MCRSFASLGIYSVRLRPAQYGQLFFKSQSINAQYVIWCVKQKQIITFFFFGSRGCSSRASVQIAMCLLFKFRAVRRGAVCVASSYPPAFVFVISAFVSNEDKRHKWARCITAHCWIDLILLEEFCWGKCHRRRRKQLHCHNAIELFGRVSAGKFFSFFFTVSERFPSWLPFIIWI